MNTKETYTLRDRLLEENGYEDYRHYLQSTEWRIIKEKIKARKGRKWNYCNVCGINENLNVHHSSYKVIGSTNPGNTVKILCQKCHHALHEITKGDPVINFYDAFRKLRKIRLENGFPIFEFIP